MLKRAVAIAALIGAVHAHAAPCPTDAQARTDAIRAHLDREARRAHRWDLGWGVVFGVAAVGYGVMADERWELGLTLGDAQVSGLWVGAVKAGIGSISHAVLPLDVERVGAATGDACADEAAAERALEETAKHESTAFWLSLAGGVLLNGGGLLYLGIHDHAWGEGALSAAVGIPVTLVHSWTAPHASRRAVDEGRLDGPPATWQLDAVSGPRFSGLVLSGSF